MGHTHVQVKNIVNYIVILVLLLNHNKPLNISANDTGVIQLYIFNF